MSKPFISICIPAYENVAFLKRLLDSIAMQTYQDFEVVLTDDSSDDTVANLIDASNYVFPMVYIKNKVALGSPENWNEGIRNARGEYVKMMHNDDWFTSDESLELFAKHALQHPKAAIIFSGFTEVEAGIKRTEIASKYHLRMLKRSPLHLFKKNFIGHPSTTLIKNIEGLLYDRNIKWVVDIEYYMRLLFKYDFACIRKPLVNIGIHEGQITKQVFRNPAVEIPETLYLLHKLPINSLQNIYVFDYYWRLLRNLSVRTIDDLERHSKKMEIPAIIQKMLQVQSKWPKSFLRNGLVSKSVMLYTYLTNNKTL